MGVIASASVDSGLSCLVFMARFLRLPVDPEQIRFEAGKVDQSFTAQDIVRAARLASVWRSAALWATSRALSISAGASFRKMTILTICVLLRAMLRHAGLSCHV